MSARRESVQFTSKFVTSYNKLFQGLTPNQIGPNQDAETFWSNLLELDVDRDFLSNSFVRISKADSLGRLKPVLNAITLSCLRFARNMQHEDVKKAHALETLSILSRYILGKNLAGWEVMDVFAGGVSQSDQVFNDLTSMIEDTLNDIAAPASVRHQTLQLAVIFVCGVNQLSVGAYFLRRDLFPCIVTTIISPETEQYGFEAVLLLSLLANFHKSDAAKLNPYLACIRNTTNTELMRKICWVSNFAADAVVKSYQTISDDSPATLGTAFGSLLTSLRPDRALASTPVDPPRELFKQQPIEACVILLPVFEFLSANETFRGVLIDNFDDGSEKISGSRIAPLPYTLLTLSSYLLSHASSTSSPRATAYANLALNILLVMAESNEIMTSFCMNKADIRLCRQRLPLLPLSPTRAPVCALLDCCVLWLRHNLHKKLEVYSYIACVRVCFRTLWYLQKERAHLDYLWQDFWRALIGLLDFLSNKLESLTTTGGVERLVQETLLVLDLALCHSDNILPNPKAVHELVYEVVRSAGVFVKQKALLEKLALPVSLPRKGGPGLKNRVTEALASMTALTDYYETKIREAGAQSANRALRTVAKEVDKDGLVYSNRTHGAEGPPKQSEELVGFIRYAYADGMALMP